MNCPKCNKSDKIDKFHTIEPVSMEPVKSEVCLRCMTVVSSESGDHESVIHQVREQISF